MARARLELGLVGGGGGRVLLIVAGGGQAFGQRAIRRVGLKPALVPAAVSQPELRRSPLLRRELLQLVQQIGGPRRRRRLRCRPARGALPAPDWRRRTPALPSRRNSPRAPGSCPAGHLQQAGGVSGEIGHGGQGPLRGTLRPKPR